MQKWIILIIVILVIILTAFIVLNTNIETEYTPEGEITEDELRKTIVKLCFKGKEDGSIVTESRLIDSKDLLVNPYEKMVKLLLDGPESDRLEKIIPENVECLSTRFEEGYVIISFNSEFINENISNETRELVATSIYETLKDFTEVKGIRIMVDDNIINELPKESME